jgi:hypothetical protein
MKKEKAMKRKKSQRRRIEKTGKHIKAPGNS